MVERCQVHYILHFTGAKYPKEAAGLFAWRKRGTGEEKEVLLKNSQIKVFPPKRCNVIVKYDFQGRLEEELMSTRLREVEKW